MPPLATQLRTDLEKSIGRAREAAEAAADDALAILAVAGREPFATMTTEERALRNALRAKARQFGGGSLDKGLQFLKEEIAYEQWHRMLFARFLAENNLLMYPGGTVPITLEECEELAPEEGEADAWQLAARYASAMLPGIFRTDDPSSRVRFAPEGRNKLEAILTSMPTAVYTADDSLGWVYQFWQTKRDKEIRASGRKIGADEISPVTQRFTEHYMVQFLLENSLGAWWAARHPDSPLVKTFTYLRFLDDGTPAAGTFPGWPDRARDVTVMDPCCGSGHFLVAAFEMLRRMRMEEEGLSERDAADVVLRDNLFGLEIDPRCVQIAAFALAFAAWKAGGYRPLPLPSIACSGIPVVGQLDTWTKLAGDDPNLRTTLERLYYLFQQAPTLGSLINPADVPLRDRMFTPDYAQVEPVLQKALAKERYAEDPVAEVFGAAAEGVTRAAKLLRGKYTFVATNVPYLVRGKQEDVLKGFCALHYPDSKANLATTFVERCCAFVAASGSYALVTPENWLSQASYKVIRTRMLKEQVWNHSSWLGPGAFETITGEVVKPVLLILTNRYPADDQEITGLDASGNKGAQAKAVYLCNGALQSVSQAAQLKNPDARIILSEPTQLAYLSEYALTYQGMKTGDDPRYRRCFWEIADIEPGWRLYETTVEMTKPYDGRELLLDWRCQGRDMARKQGMAAWGEIGVAVSQMGQLPVTLYSGDAFDSNAAVIIPRNPDYLPALWAFCQSVGFVSAVRQVDDSHKVTDTALVKIPFDFDHWQKVAEEAGPLPEPYSNDPTQWLFEGHPKGSTAPLQVGVVRLLGYRWPQQQPDRLDTLADEDGIVCLPPVGAERPAAERLRALLQAAYGNDWSPMQEDKLLAEVGYRGKTLDTWLRDGFFEQHCSLFHNRPFIWHVWDGRRDGFSALVNYHKLNGARLDRLIYTYLGSWIEAQRGDRDAGVAGAEGRYLAALQLQDKLKAIRTGEHPYDIYVRWKSLHRQPWGWEPDLNDGVRLNIRPLVIAGVLRSRFNIKWNKDRGTNPDGSERHNDKHYTLAEKQAARRAIGL